MERQWPLYAAMPISITCCGDVMPSAWSISYSTGRPWQSQPKLQRGCDNDKQWAQAHSASHSQTHPQRETHPQVRLNK
jgi:hypothetical protein